MISIKVKPLSSSVIFPVCVYLLRKNPLVRTIMCYTRQAEGMGADEGKTIKRTYQTSCDGTVSARISRQASARAMKNTDHRIHLQHSRETHKKFELITSGNSIWQVTVAHCCHGYLSAVILHCPNRLLNMTDGKISDPLYQQHPSHDVFLTTTRHKDEGVSWRDVAQLCGTCSLVEIL